MIHADPSDPPPNWSPFPVVKLTNGIYYGWAEGDEKPWFYHWCSAGQRWAGHGTGNHILVEREPLTLEPSLHWPGCCGLHGWSAMALGRTRRESP